MKSLPFHTLIWLPELAYSTALLLSSLNPKVTGWRNDCATHNSTGNNVSYDILSCPEINFLCMSSSCKGQSRGNRLFIGIQLWQKNKTGCIRFCFHSPSKGQTAREMDGYGGCYCSEPGNRYGEETFGKASFSMMWRTGSRIFTFLQHQIGATLKTLAFRKAVVIWQWATGNMSAHLRCAFLHLSDINFLKLKFDSFWDTHMDRCLDG